MADNKSNEHLPNHFSRSFENRSKYICFLFSFDRTPRISQQTKKSTKEKDVGAASAAGSNGGEKTENDHETTAAAVAIPGLEIDAKNE